MKKNNEHASQNDSEQDNNNLLKQSLAKHILQQPDEEFIRFNETLISSLPYPALYIRRKDRVILAANKIAVQLGARVGDYCWKVFAKKEGLSANHNKVSYQYPEKIPDQYHIKCTFCQGDNCIFGSPCQNNSEVEIFGRFWNVYWIKVNDEVFLHYLIDMTESRLLEDSLRESVWFLKHTQQVAMIGTYSINLENNTWVSSEVLDNILGLEFQPVRQANEWFDLVHPDMKEMMLDYFKNEVIKKKQKFDKEYKIKRKNDLAERWVHCIGYLNFDQENKPIKLIGAIHDITERKRSESEIIRNLKFTEVLLNSVPTPVFYKDIEGRYIGCNKSFTEQMGFSNEEIRGKNVFDVLPKEQAQLQHEKDLFLLNTEEFQSYEAQITDKKGNTRDVLLEKSVFYDENSRVIGIVGVYIDITEVKKVERELRESEQKYKLLSQNITDGIFTCRNGKIEYVNQSMCRIFGYDMSDLEGKKLSELIIPSKRTEFESFISVEPSTDQISNIEIECLSGKDSTVFVELFLNYVAAEGLTYGVMHNITEKKQIQERNIVKAIIQTEERERSSFSRELHDGIGPLLSTIKLYLQWSMRPKSNISSLEIIKKAEEVVEEAIVAIKEISNKLSPHLLTNYGLKSAIQSFAMKLVETNTIRISFESDLDRRIELETEVALYRAVIECVNNTIKYAKAKHIHIKLTDEGHQVKLEYRDDGRGFDIAKIMIEKKGLGLFNLQNRIQTIGGEIRMFSKPQRGVNYHITVPLKQKMELSTDITNESTEQ